MCFYKQSPDEVPHRFYCGVDLHARCMYLCILDPAGQDWWNRRLARFAQAGRLCHQRSGA